MFPPIAMLHYVSDAAAYGSLGNWCVSHKSFLQLLTHLEENDFQTITFADIVRDKNILKSPRRKMILTFDDGPRHLFDFAIPQLQKRNMKACFYIPTAHIGSYNSWDVKDGMARVELMNEADIKELAILDMEVGAHAHHHIKLKQVTDAGALKEEVIQSKSILEGLTQKPVYSFAYPYASVPKFYKPVLTAAGYRFALSIYYPFENNLTLRRFGYYNSDTKRSLRLKLSPLYKGLRMLYDPLKNYA